MAVYNNFNEKIQILAKSSEQHAGFPGGHPSKYSPRPTQFHFGDRTRTGAFGVVWPLTI